MFVDLYENNFENNISTGLKLVEFYAKWCHYCNQQEPILKELSDDGIWVGGVDVDANPNITKEYNITSFPSFILFKNNQIVKQFQGLHSKYELMNILRDYI